MTLEELKDSDFVVGMKETERAIEKREGDRPRVWHQSESRCCRCPEETLISSAFLKDPR